MRLHREMRPSVPALVFFAIGCGSSSADDLNGSGGSSAGGSAGTAAGAAPSSAGSAGGPGPSEGGETSTAGAPSSGAGGTPSSAGAPSGGTAGTGSGGAPVAGAAGAPAGSPAPGQYGTRRQLLAANSEMAVAEVGGKIYVLGGYPSSRVTQDTVQAYDPQTDMWAYVESLPMPLHHPVVVGVAGKLYSLGGQADGGDTNQTFEYDPVANSWRPLANMPTARGAGAAAVIGDQIFVVGGRPPAGNAFEMYDISENAWTPLADLPQAFPDRNHIAAGAVGGKVYVAGGRHSGGSFSDPMTASLDIYDPVARSWSAGAPMLRPRGGVNGVFANGCFHVWGGEGPNTGEPNNVFPDHDVYNPATNSWRALPDLPTPVHGVTGAAFLNGLIYIPGGGLMQGGSSGSTIFQVYRPDMNCQ